MNERLLREFIAAILLEEVDEKLLGEPDFVDGRDSEDSETLNGRLKGGKHSKKEQAVVSAIAGVTTPLGTGPTYPNPKRKKRKNRKK